MRTYLLDGVHGCCRCGSKDVEDEIDSDVEAECVGIVVAGCESRCEMLLERSEVKQSWWEASRSVLTKRSSSRRVQTFRFHAHEP